MCVFDGDVLRFGTAVGSGGDVGVEDAFAGEGSSGSRLDDCAVGVVFDVDGAVVVGDDGIAGHRDPVRHCDGGFL